MQHVDAEEALRSPRRRHLMAAMQANPGIAFRELSRLVELAPGTARHHLNVLRRAGCIVERQHGITLRFFQAADDDKTAWAEVILRRDPALAALHDWLKLHPRAPQGDVLEAMAAHGWPRSTTQHRLGRLVEAGVVAIFLSGRFKLYSATTRPIDLAATAATIQEAAAMPPTNHSTRHDPTEHGPEPWMARGTEAQQPPSTSIATPAPLFPPVPTASAQESLRPARTHGLPFAAVETGIPS